MQVFHKATLEKGLKSVWESLEYAMIESIVLKSLLKRRPIINIAVGWQKNDGDKTDLSGGARSGGANILLLGHACSAACTGGDGLGLSGLEIEDVTTVGSHGRVLNRDGRGQGDEGEDNSGKSELHFGAVNCDKECR